MLLPEIRTARRLRYPRMVKYKRSLGPEPFELEEISRILDEISKLIETTYKLKKEFASRFEDEECIYRITSYYDLIIVIQKYMSENASFPIKRLYETNKIVFKVDHKNYSESKMRWKVDEVYITSDTKKDIEKFYKEVLEKNQLRISKDVRE